MIITLTDDKKQKLKRTSIRFWAKVIETIISCIIA